MSGRVLLSYRGCPGGSDGKESACNAGDPGLIHGSGRSPGGGKGYPLQYFGLGNPMDGGAWWATVHGVEESDTTELLTLSLHFPVPLRRLRSRKASGREQEGLDA